ncbi:retrovirus-related pol polyprotein from transposon TNT 1-94 [Tanacetum coccineum]
MSRHSDQLVLIPIDLRGLPTLLKHLFMDQVLIAEGTILFANMACKEDEADEWILFQEEKPKPRQDSLDQKLSLQDSKISLYKFILRSNTRHQHPIRLPPRTLSVSKAAQDARWREAMQKEVKALEKNGTWTLEYLPEGKRAIDSKWVYKIKFKPNEEVEKYKALLVAKGFNQMEGVDYHDTFAPAAKLVTVHTLLAIWFSRKH